MIAIHFALRLDATVAPDVPDGDPPLVEKPPDEEPAVAPDRVLLAAKQDYPAVSNLPF